MPTAGNSFLTGSYKEDRALFSDVLRRRTTGKRHKLENRKSHISIRSCQTLEQVVQSLSLEILKTWLDKVLTTCSNNLLWAGGCSRWMPEVPSNLHGPQIASVWELCVLQYYSSGKLVAGTIQWRKGRSNVALNGVFWNIPEQSAGEERDMGQMGVGFCTTLLFWEGFF